MSALSSWETQFQVDVDENQDLAMQFEIMAVPTVVGVTKGAEAKRFSGLIEEDAIQEFIRVLTYWLIFKNCCVDF